MSLKWQSKIEINIDTNWLTNQNFKAIFYLFFPRTFPLSHTVNNAMEPAKKSLEIILVDQFLKQRFIVFLFSRHLLMNEVLQSLKEVAIEKPVDVIIRQIKELLISGQLKPGDKLPPERKLSEQFAVGRTHVREALRKLEFYGILKTMPQSGTFVAGIGITALKSLIADVLKIDSPSFLSLVETRVLLEEASIKLACERRTEEDLRQLELSLNAYLEKAKRGIKAIDEDLMFHLTIADLSKNKVLKSLLLIIIPDIISNYSVFKVCDTVTARALKEHQQLFDCIKKGEGDKGTAVMREHLKGVMDFAKSLVQ